MQKCVPLKYLSNFCKSLETSLINCKFHIYLNWAKNCVTYRNNAYAATDNNNNNNNNNDNTTF